MPATLTNYWTGVWTDLRQAIATVWPEVGVNFRALQVERVNWANLVNSGQITPPYVVIQLPPAQESEEWGLGNVVYQITPSFHYIAQNSGDIGAALEAKIKLMQDYARAYPTYFDTLQCLDSGMTIDVSESNPINATMLEAGYPYTAGTFSFQAIAGETVVE